MHTGGAVIMKQHKRTANGHKSKSSAYLVNCSINFHWNDKISIVDRLWRTQIEVLRHGRFFFSPKIFNMRCK